MLITAGPTHEPIDEVRYIANRSSGTMGAAIAQAASDAGWEVTLLLGPTPQRPHYPNFRLERFRGSRELQELLEAHFPACDVLVMAAAVADYRPRNVVPGKLRRGDHPIKLELEPVPDLVAGCAGRRRPGQVVVAFALEARERLAGEARAKLERKKVDLIVANPLETMESPDVEGVVLERLEGGDVDTHRPESATLDKAAFAAWLVRLIEKVRDERG